MDGIEYIKKLDTKALNQKNIDKLESKYNSEFPIIINKIISTNQKPIFLDNEFRVLSYAEILNANKQLGVDFISLHLIPILDCYNNDFICYNFKIKKWCMFNVIDECVFNERKDLKDYF